MTKKEFVIQYVLKKVESNRSMNISTTIIEAEKFWDRIQRLEG